MTEQNMMLAGRTAVVTGGSRGIGRAIVLRLAAQGAAVVFSYRGDHAAAEGVVDQVRAAGGSAWAVRADQAELSDIARLFAAADQHFAAAEPSTPDIVVVNAGIPATTPITEVTAADYDRVMAVNSRGAFFTVQHALRRMPDGGRIIAVSSMTTVYASPGEAVYAASKAALEQFVRVAAKEAGARGITVNAVAPGPTDTDLLRGAVPDEALAGVARMTPLGRLGRGTDIADVVAFLAGPDSGWITAQTIHANGGLG